MGCCLTPYHLHVRIKHHQDLLLGDVSWAAGQLTVDVVLEAVVQVGTLAIDLGLSKRYWSKLSMCSFEIADMLPQACKHAL